jgi:hypothetical protein
VPPVARAEADPRACRGTSATGSTNDCTDAATSIARCVRRRFARIDETGNSQPRPDQERMAAVLSDIAFRETYTAAALRNGWIVRQVAA